MIFIYFGIVGGLALIWYMIMVKCNNCWRPSSEKNIWLCEKCDKAFKDL